MATAKKTIVSKNSARKLSKKTVKKTKSVKAVTKKSPTKKPSNIKVLKKNAKKPSSSNKSSSQVKILKPKNKDTILKPNKENFKLGFPRSISLAIIAVPKLPLDFNTLAVGMARYGGIALVFFGAFFSLWHATALGIIPNNLVASVLTAGSTLSMTTVDSENTIYDSSTVINKTPEAHITTDKSSPVEDYLTVKVIVPDAKRIDLVLFNVDSRQSFTIGSLTKKATNEWEIKFDSAKYPDSEYRIKSVIINDHGSYSELSDDYYQFANQQNDSGITQTDSQISSTDPSTSSSFSITLKSPPEASINDKVRLYSSTSEVVNDMIFISVSETGTIRTLGRGQSTNGKDYFFDWDTTPFNDGKYYIFTQTKYDSTNHRSQKVLVEVLNSQTTQTNTELDSTTTTKYLVDSSSSSTNSDSLEDIDFNNETFSLEFRSEKNNPQSDLAYFKLHNNLLIDKIEIYQKRLIDSDFKYLGFAHKIDDYSWQLVWDTKNTPNGRYVLLPKAYSKSTDKYYFGNVLQVDVYNQLTQTNTQKN
jgi:hypothetical protein